MLIELAPGIFVRPDQVGSVQGVDVSMGLGRTDIAGVKILLNSGKEFTLEVNSRYTKLEAARDLANAINAALLPAGLVPND